MLCSGTKPAKEHPDEGRKKEYWISIPGSHQQLLTTSHTPAMPGCELHNVPCINVRLVWICWTCRANCSDEKLMLETSVNTLFTAFSISTSTLRWYIVRFTATLTQTKTSLFIERQLPFVLWRNCYKYINHLSSEPQIYSEQQRHLHLSTKHFSSFVVNNDGCSIGLNAWEGGR